MAYSQVAAANVQQLLDAVVTFATANGWAVEYNEAAADGKQVALSSGVCRVALGEMPGNPYGVPLPFGQDARFAMSLTGAFGVGKNYWSHDYVDTPGDYRRVVVNDVLGPMPSVQFFGDARSVFCVVQSSPNRWATFGFGMLDRAGGDVAFCGGHHHAFWPNVDQNAQMVSRAGQFFHGPTATNGQWGCGLSVFVPDGILDPAFGFSDGPVFAVYALPDAARDTLMAPWLAVSELPQNGSDNQGAGIAETAWYTTPTLTTGGMPAITVPIIAAAKNNGNLSFLGNLPTVRLCRAPNTPPGDVVLYGDTEFVIVPMKQKGVISDTRWGGIDNGQPNTLDFGYALQKG